MKARVTFHEVKHSDAIENRINEYADKLERFCDEIIDIHAVVEHPKKSQYQGDIYQVKLEIKVPDKTIVVDRDQNKDAYGAIRDAFFTARRQLQEYVERRRGH
jgi:ribosomal subunit interface protein